MHVFQKINTLIFREKGKKKKSYNKNIKTSCVYAVPGSSGLNTSASNPPPQPHSSAYVLPPGTQTFSASERVTY